jgi:hypothetical protein
MGGADPRPKHSFNLSPCLSANAEQAGAHRGAVTGPEGI